ncbi:MAG: phosphomethylpyrimidine synthase ThiC, partial [Acidobacteriota bacterium]|nr:phosphomethylpyrimidine synthase ThiC [Acidobacteriota bacterium]
TAERMFEYIRRQAGDGVDFMTIHAGLTLAAIDKLRQKPRLAGVVSRGGSMLIAWMLHNNRENPFFERFDELLQIAREFDVTLSLGDGLRPGSLADGSDWAQMEELLTLGGLVQRSRRAGVQVMVEGPGHLPIQQVEMNILLQKEVCAGAPFYVLGPVVTDVAPGYDHVTAAIGSAIAGAAGADFLCYVTPAEHLGLPDVQDVRDGIMASRIAAHVADIAKGLPGAQDWDRRMAAARRGLDWAAQEKLCLDPERFRRVRARRTSHTDACSMCGEFCVYKVLENLGI